MHNTSLSLNPIEEQPQQSVFSRLLFGSAIASFVIGTAVVGYGGYHLWKSQNQIINPITCTEAAREELVYVDVSGAVKSPGVYELQVGSRVADALAVAGGLQVDADPTYVHQSLNMAHNVSDGQKIYIPTKAEQVAGVAEAEGEGASEEKQEVGQEKVTGSGSATGISINNASSAQLETLPGIGPARASAIIEGRPFSAIEELLEKKLIPESVLSEITSLLQL
ncbi:MAG: SLBB domain-containing protein [Patescibacteria group bacterium]